MGEAGSFDDLLDEDDLDDEPGEPPATPLDEADDAATPTRGGNRRRPRYGWRRTRRPKPTMSTTPARSSTNSKTRSKWSASTSCRTNSRGTRVRRVRRRTRSVWTNSGGTSTTTRFDGEEPSESAVDDILVDAESDEPPLRTRPMTRTRPKHPVSTRRTGRRRGRRLCGGRQRPRAGDRAGRGGVIADDDDVAGAETDDYVAAAETDDDVAGGPDDEIEAAR